MKVYTRLIPDEKIGKIEQGTTQTKKCERLSRVPRRQKMGTIEQGTTQTKKWEITLTERFRMKFRNFEKLA